MNKKKKISISIFIFSIILGLYLATQSFAKNTGYSPALGNSWFVLNNKPYYNPFSYLIWFVRYKYSAPLAISKASGVLFINFLMSMLIIVFINRNKKNMITSHGSAEWANSEDIEKMGFYLNSKETMKEYEESGMDKIYKENIEDEEELHCNGIILGRDEKGRELMDSGGQHVLMTAQTGGGKGVSVVIPTLLTWKGSCIINDIKGENWEKTAPYRKSIGQKCLKFSPTELGSSCSYNPLSEVRVGTPYEYQEVRTIANILISPGKNDDFFGPSAVNYLTGVILYVLYTKKNASLNDVYGFITTPSLTEEQKLKKMKKSNHNADYDEKLFEKIYSEVITIDGDEKPRIHPVVSRVGGDMLGRADKERSGIISSAKTRLTVFSDPIISRNTRESDFKISDLMNYETPVSLYFVTPPKSLNITGILMKLLITQIVNILTSDGSKKNYRHRLLFLIDEFPTLGRMDDFHSALAYIRGYGMKALLITQDLKQLTAVYGRDNSIQSNCKISIFFTTNDLETAKTIENKLGNKTIRVKNLSYKGFKYFSDWNYSESHIGRALKTVAEITQLDEEETIIFTNGKPINGRKIRYWKEEKYMNRVNRLEPLIESDTITEGEKNEYK